jgi:hypothetical protein
VNRLLVAGGRNDPNLGWLAAAAGRIGVETTSVLVDPDNPPALDWSLESGRASVGGEAIECTAAFLRYDVFSGLAEGRQEAAVEAGAWFAALSAICSASGLFTLNRDIDLASSSKPTMLVLAKQAGLRIPPTIVTNARESLAKLEGPAHIAKPVAGGSYVMPLVDAMAQARWSPAGTSPAPAIIQPMLIYPERRIYRVGGELFAFDIASRTLDSRLDSGCTITALPIAELPAAITASIRRLTDELRCDFCAIDMKTDPETGDLVFLELNNGPMFMGYDRAAGGTMAEAMVRYLVGART